MMDDPQSNRRGQIGDAEILKADPGVARRILDWITENWNEESNLGKAKLAALAVLAFMFVLTLRPGPDPAPEARLPEPVQAGVAETEAVQTRSEETSSGSLAVPVAEEEASPVPVAEVVSADEVDRQDIARTQAAPVAVSPVAVVGAEPEAVQTRSEETSSGSLAVPVAEEEASPAPVPVVVSADEVDRGDIARTQAAPVAVSPVAVVGAEPELVSADDEAAVAPPVEELATVQTMTAESGTTAQPAGASEYSEGAISLEQAAQQAADVYHDYEARVIDLSTEKRELQRQLEQANAQADSEIPADAAQQASEAYAQYEGRVEMLETEKRELAGRLADTEAQLEKTQQEVAELKQQLEQQRSKSSRELALEELGREMKKQLESLQSRIDELLEGLVEKSEGPQPL